MFRRKKSTSKPEVQPAVVPSTTERGTTAAPFQEPTQSVPTPPGTPHNVRILYEKTGAAYASQFVANSKGDQVILDFSTGVISDPTAGVHTLPIQARVAMTPATALNLMNTLIQILQPKQADESPIELSS